MNYSWIKLSNPVALWWLFLNIASLFNIILWNWTRLYKYKNFSILKFKFWELKSENLIWLSAIYVFGCAYRSYFLKADVQRICVFDSWFSSVFLGRSIATFAELAFIIQWTIVLKKLCQMHKLDTIKILHQAIIPLIIIAECFSWYAVITTNYLGNVIEESLWATTYFLIFILIWNLKKKYFGAFKFAIITTLFLDFIYLLFMITVDIKMYFNRYINDTNNQKVYLTFKEGILDLNTKWIVTHDIYAWKTEIPWITLYFSFAVLVSIGLCLVPLTIEKKSK